MLGICTYEMLRLLSYVAWRGTGQATETVAQVIDDARQRVGELVDLMVEDRHDQGDKAPEGRQAEQQTEHGTSTRRPTTRGSSE